MVDPGPRMNDDDRRVVIVGSGPAGAAALVGLAREGIQATLLDAGPSVAAAGLTVRVGGFTVAKWRRRLEPRGQVSMTGDPNAKIYEDLAPGGLTNHWSCAVPRFSPEDFKDGERAGEAFTWPVGYDDLIPWYDVIEPYLHIAGSTMSLPHLPAGRVRRGWTLPKDWEPLAEAARAEGRSVAPLPYVYGSDTSVTLSGTVFNAYVRMVRPAERAGRVTVRHDARVLRLEWSPASRGVNAVIFRDLKTGLEERIRCKAVVLAAGAINTTQILLESRSQDFPEGLGNTHGVLGTYLHDHPLGKVMIDLGRPQSFHPPVYVTRRALDRADPLYATGCAQWGGVTLMARSVLSRHPGRLPWAGFNVFGTMAPSPTNRVSLDTSRAGHDGASALSLHIEHPPEVTRLMEESRDALIGLLDQAGMRPRLRIWHMEHAGVAHHYGGTARMHRDPKFGVTDAWSRLHSVRNVAVADSAAFTTTPEKNPVLTAMALGARASARLAADLRSASA